MKTISSAESDLALSALRTPAHESKGDNVGSRYNTYFSGHLSGFAVRGGCAAKQYAADRLGPSPLFVLRESSRRRQRESEIPRSRRRSRRDKAAYASITATIVPLPRWIRITEGLQGRADSSHTRVLSICADWLVDHFFTHNFLPPTFTSETFLSNPSLVEMKECQMSNISFVLLHFVQKRSHLHRGFDFSSVPFSLFEILLPTVSSVVNFPRAIR